MRRILILLTALAVAASAGMAGASSTETGGRDRLKAAFGPSKPDAPHKWKSAAAGIAAKAIMGPTHDAKTFLCNKAPAKVTFSTGGFGILYSFNGDIIANPGKTGIDPWLLVDEYHSSRYVSDWTFYPISQENYSENWWVGGVTGKSALKAYYACILTFQEEPWGYSLKSVHWVKQVMTGDPTSVPLELEDYNAFVGAYYWVLAKT